MEALLKNDEIDPLQKRLIYTHKLKQGISKIDHYGITLARSSGLPRSIVEEAQELALNFSKNLKFKQNDMTERERRVVAQRKINYDAMIAIYKEFSKETVDTDYIYQIMKNIKEIDYTGCEIADQHEQVSVLSTLTGRRTETAKKKQELMSQEEFKKPQAVQPQLVKKVASNQENIQPIKRFLVPGSEFEASPSKIPKLASPLKTSTPFSKKSVDVKPLAERNYDQSMNLHLSSLTNSKKILANPFNDPDSPLFIPKSQPTVFNPSQNNCLSELRSPSLAKDKSRLTYSKVDPRYHVPNQFYGIQKLFKQISLSPESKRKQQESSDTSSKNQTSSETFTENFANGPAIPSTSRTEVQSFKINTSTCKIPEEYSYMRHILKNLPWQKNTEQLKEEVKTVSNKVDNFYFSSDVVTRNTNLPTNDRENIEHLLRYQSPSKSSIEDVNPLDFCQVLTSGPSDLDRMLSREINQNHYELTPDTSQTSVTTAAARMLARKKEAEIFKLIEGDAFNEESFLCSDKSYISIE